MPAYNEAATIEAVIDEHAEVLQGADVADWEIVVLDDCSADGTKEILARVEAREPRLRTLHNDRNRGLAFSFRHVCQQARFEYVYATASDGQWPASNLLPMLAAARAATTDLVVGVRTNRREVYGWNRLFISMCFNLLSHVLFGVVTRDAGSVKLARREIYSMPLVSRSPFMEAERIILAETTGRGVVFVPVRFRRREDGDESGAKWPLIWGSLGDVWRCFVAYRLGRIHRGTQRRREGVG